MIRIAVDGMGGDNAPKIVCEGVNLALKSDNELEITIFGNEVELLKFLEPSSRLHIINSPYKVDMGEKNPISVYRQHSLDASMFMAIKHVGDGLSDAVVSAGPTQAYIVGLSLILKKMEGIDRIAIAPILPDVHGRGKILLDGGANIELKPEHLVEFAVVASKIAKDVYKWNDNPRVGLINIGTEPGKGREFDKDSYKLLSECKDINFIGNIEPKECMTGDFEVILGDGFTCNILMKTMEGTGKGVSCILKDSIKSGPFQLLGAMFMKKSLNKLKFMMNPASIGGAMIIGLRKIGIKAHGSSDGLAIKNAILQAKKIVISNVIETIKKA